MLEKTTRSILAGWGFGGFTPKKKKPYVATSGVSTIKRVGFTPFTYCLKGGQRGYPPRPAARPYQRARASFLYPRRVGWLRTL